MYQFEEKREIKKEGKMRKICSSKAKYKIKISIFKLGRPMP